MKRTNIVLDEKLIKASLRATGLKTQKDVVAFALNELIRHENQKKILELEGVIKWNGTLSRTRKNRG